MSKYKDRANEILESIANKNTDENGERIYYLWEVEKAMCQLAEEVEITTYNTLIKSKVIGKLEAMVNQPYYTKQQVEELLQKQRELCVKEATTIHLGNNFVIVDDNSILNARLKID